MNGKNGNFQHSHLEVQLLSFSIIKIPKVQIRRGES